ncbi:MAG: hypothetical protein HYZ16_11735 [Bacteroidetes bacterium]|jgi:hypothetical protein|nr:hypothetical protein [Bacteroidota bacterium]
MNIDFNVSQCQCQTDKARFGLCDTPSHAKTPAYLDEVDASNWIAIVDNKMKYLVTFTAIDHCIDMKRQNGKMLERCDCMLTYCSTVILVELKKQRKKGNAWVKKADSQLRNTIKYFERSQSNLYTEKRAYIANSEKPMFKDSQMERMKRFYEETGYILKIKAEIELS